MNNALVTYDAALIGSMRNAGAWSSWLPALPECFATVIDGTAAVTLGSAVTGDCRIYGVLILKDATPATATISGLGKLAPTGALTSATGLVITGSTADDRFVSFHGAINEFGPLTITASVDEKVIVFWRQAELYPASLVCTPARNALPMGLVDWNTVNGSQVWGKVQVNGGTVTTSGDTVICATNGASGRAMVEFDVSSMVTAQALNRVILLSVELAEDFTGVTNNGVCGFSGSSTVVSGDIMANLPNGTYKAGTRIGVRCVVSAASSMAIRIGVGVNNVEGSAMTLKFRKPTLEFADFRSAGPYGEAIPYASDALFDYLPNFTFSNTNSGVITFDRTLSLPAYGSAQLCVGDSFGNDAGLSAGLSGDWPDMYRKLRPDLAMINRCNSGWTLTQMAANIVSWLTLSDGSSFMRKPTEAVNQGGINDIFASGSLAHNPVPTMMTKVAEISAAELAAGIPSDAITWVGLAPCSGSASHNVGNGHVSKITSYNAALRSYCAANGFNYANAYDVLKGGASSSALKSRFDVGDQLHPNSEGFMALAEAADYAKRRGIKSLRQL